MNPEHSLFQHIMILDDSHPSSLKSRASAVQSKDAKEICEEFAKIYLDYPFKRIAMLDIGSDTGYLLMNVIAPILGVGFEKIVAVDRDPESVQILRECYCNRQGFQFKQLDIESPDLPEEYEGQFDRVTSFYCLNFVRDHRLALENISKCLRSGGDCLLVFLASNTTYEVFKTLSKDRRFSDYLNQTMLDKVISPFHDHPVVDEEFESLLDQEGFINRHVEIRNRTFSYIGFESFVENMRAIDVFHVPVDIQHQYYEAFCQCLIDLGLQEKVPEVDDYKFTIKYTIVVASARKA